jgi:glycosyltransferase involved in cell wall biosynthesis
VAVSSLTTVAVICCNYARFLRQAVQSAVLQTRTPRVLILDDASTDETPAVAGELVREYRDVDYHRLPANIGLSRVRNLAAEVATSDWVIFLDADDWLDAAYIERGEAFVATHPGVDVLTTDMTIVRNEMPGRVFTSRVPEVWTDLLERNSIVQTSFIRRDLVRRLGYDPALAFEDWDFWIRVLQHGGRIERLAGAHVFRREHGRNKSKICDEGAATAAVLNKHRGRLRRGGASESD